MAGEMQVLFLLAAAFLGGALNAIAGGGTFITFPALVYAGIPPVMASATSATAVLPGYLSSAVAFRRDVGPAGRLGVAWITAISFVGGTIGAGLLLVTPSDTFEGIVPWMLLVATVLFACGPLIRQRLRSVRPAGPLVAAAAIFLVSIYGGFFNGGLGVLLLALFTLMGLTDMSRMNGLKSAISAVLCLISVIVFSSGGLVDWRAASTMMIAAAAGGFVGARLTRWMPAALVRGIIVVVGSTMVALFFWRTH
ncbi:sulfite exporter TauE/SafE family protein [Aminobacter aminovorans]|uniref:Probable membrane transporter protein n=1 Tax=Aminobacter aminovorans TaxID=83263 RepID=A0AAC8YQV9_AMIAI|nr:sulfite exporter TauE/SafE family protein [Aminobacter aminovorans]AMS42875.1 membrane protein [Aminobacter aminovorans]MBB3704724.1 hypothetical protein [Aminobacter aminovorans]